MFRNRPGADAPDQVARLGPLSRRQVIYGGSGVVLAALILGGRGHPVQHDRPRLTPVEAFGLMQRGAVTVVDIRTPKEWRSSGIAEGAVPLDMRRDDFFMALDEILAGQRDAPVAVICARGGRSARMVKAMTAAGFTTVMEIPAGMFGSRAGPGWIAEGLPVALWEGG